MVSSLAYVGLLDYVCEGERLFGGFSHSIFQRVLTVFGPIPVEHTLR